MMHKVLLASVAALSVLTASCVQPYWLGASVKPPPMRAHAKAKAAPLQLPNEMLGKWYSMDGEDTFGLWSSLR